MQEKEDIGHWTFGKDFNPEDWIGFIYQITHISTGRSYIGKKFFWSTTRKVIVGRKNRKKIIKPSNWKKYTGSSTWLNSEINLHGMDQFKFEILSLHESRGTLALREVELLVSNNVLRAKAADGTKLYFNGLIPPIKFTPGDETEREKLFKV